MEKDVIQGIVIQGPTKYCKDVVPCYKDIKNVVWSTWENEPEENIKYIKQHMDVIFNDEPLVAGHLNVNYQARSTYSGVRYLEFKGVNEILKVRGDVKINKIKDLLSILKTKKMAFLAIAKEGVRKDIYYELVYSHFSHDYPVDLVVYGSTENMVNSFNFYIEENIAIPPEALIAYHFLEGLKKDFILTYKHFIENEVYFYLKDCLENNIQLLWLKNNMDLVQMHNSKEFYEF